MKGTKEWDEKEIKGGARKRGEERRVVGTVELMEVGQYMQ